MQKEFSIEELNKICKQYVLVNYEYCYLKAMHLLNQQENPQVVIAGSSHAMNGIIEQRMDLSTVNFSISSQDVFYDIMNVSKAVTNNANIKICVLNIGYYMLYQDLSMSKNLFIQIPRIYYPLFKTGHHLGNVQECDRCSWLKFDREIYSPAMVQHEAEAWSDELFAKQKTFYGTLLTRETNNGLRKKNIIWSELNDDEKNQIAVERTNDHNKLRKHTASREENGAMLEQFISSMRRIGIMPVLVIFPFTHWYNQHIDPNYKKDIIEFLENLDDEVAFLDMNDYCELFDDCDFLDSDHLNESGAEKATDLLNQFINIVAEEAI